MTADNRPVRPRPFEQTSSATPINPIGSSSTMNSTPNNNNYIPFQPEQHPANPWGEPDAPQAKPSGLLSGYKKTGLLSNPNSFVSPNQNAPQAGQPDLSDLEEQPTAPNRFAGQLASRTNQPSPFFNPGAGLPQPVELNDQAGSQFAMGGMPTAAATRNLNHSSLDASGTGMLPVPYQQSSNTIKLTGPVRVVQMPVAGQPGHYVTGFLPVLPPMEEREPEKPAMSKKMKIFAAVLVALLLLGATAGMISLRSHSQQSDTGNQPGLKSLSQANINATATAQANILLSDPLSQNIHSWPIAPAATYAFKNGAYHISSNGDKASAAVMKDIPFSDKFAYTLTMQEVKGDEANNTNTFGMILRYANANGKSKFYSFQVSNKNGGEYQFFKYDESTPNNNNDPNWPWTNLWHHNFGKEFHQGHGMKNTNTFEVIANGSKYTFIVNGKTVGNASDGGLKGGMIGMLVNQNGTEVAFSNLLVTQK